MKKFILLFLAICIGSIPQAFSQDPIFSQFYAAPLQVNPAFAGTAYGPRFNFNHRNQWPTLKAYQTYAATFDHLIESLNSSLGLGVLVDDAGNGILKTTKISAVYAYQLQVNESFFVKLGVEGSYVQNRLDWDQLVFSDQIDAELGPISPGGTPFPTEEIRPVDLTNDYADVGAGLLFYSPYLYGGVSLKHLNTPSESFLNVSENIDNGLPLRVSLHAGGQIPLGRRSYGQRDDGSFFVSPNILMVKQGDFGQVNTGAYFGLGFVFVGAWYRYAWSNSDAVIGLLGVKFDKYKLGYSYDMTVSDLSGETGGSHEISFSITFQKPDELDINDCFKMFR